jgi:hypothetical protein
VLSASASDASRDDEWAEWVAHNLALGVSEGALQAELVKNGYGADVAGTLVASTRRNPAFRAAARIAHDLQKWTSLSDVLLDLEREVHDFTRVPRVSGLSEKEFLERYYAANRPVIIEDVVGEWPACSKWTPAFFKERFGGEQVRFQKRKGGDHREAFVDHTHSASLAEYVDLLESDEGRNCYLIAHDRLLDKPAFRPLFDDLYFDPRYFNGSRARGRVFLWLGPAGATTALHRDLGNVFFAQIAGSKRVRLFPAKQMHLVYNEIGYHSEVDLEDYSIEEFPLLERATMVEEVIAPGELLFIPVGWWHWVKSLDVTITVTGNNFKFRNSFTEIF